MTLDKAGYPDIEAAIEKQVWSTNNKGLMMSLELIFGISLLQLLTFLVESVEVVGLLSFNKPLRCTSPNVGKYFIYHRLSHRCCAPVRSPKPSNYLLPSLPFPPLLLDMVTFLIVGV